MVESEDRPEMEVFNIDPAHQSLASSGHSGTAKADGGGLRFSDRHVIICGILMVIALIISIGFNIDQNVKLKHCQAATGPSDVSLCSQDWVKRAGTAYFFSKEEGDWNSSQTFCSTCGGSLVTIDYQQEMEFIIKNRGPAEYWIGLQREAAQQPWKRSNGSIFNNWYAIEGEGLCAYLNYEVVSSTWCSNNRYWICKKLVRGA